MYNYSAIVIIIHTLKTLMLPENKKGCKKGVVSNIKRPKML